MSENKRDHALFLEDMLDSINRIEQYSAGLTLDQLKKNNMAVDAIIRNFEIIGEAARNVPERIKKKYPFVEWKEAIGFRNVLIHDYFGIDLESVWDTLRKNIPSLKKNLTKAIKMEKL